MSYKAWKGVFTAQCCAVNDRLQAKLWNLENERRINHQRGVFKRRIGQLYRKHRGRKLKAKSAAAAALDDATNTLKAVDCNLLGLCEVPLSAPLPDQLCTYVPQLRVRKRHTAAYRSARSTARRVTLPDPLGAQRSRGGSWESLKRFIWVTFEHGGSRLPNDDPTAIRTEFGLDHFWEGSLVYRFTLDRAAARHCFIPTCLDARLYEAWKPPAADHADPWGLTRDLVTGKPRWPEILVEVTDFLGVTRPMGQLVSPRDRVLAVDRVDSNFMAGR